MSGPPDNRSIDNAASLPMSVTQAEFRQALGCFATGVTVITVDHESEVHGMTANAFTAVSLDPVLVLVCVDHRARTHAHLHARKRFGVNVLRNDQQTISEYYARSAETHQHPEAAGARLSSGAAIALCIGNRTVTARCAGNRTVAGRCAERRSEAASCRCWIAGGWWRRRTAPATSWRGEKCEVEMATTGA